MVAAGRRPLAEHVMGMVWSATDAEWADNLAAAALYAARYGTLAAPRCAGAVSPASLGPRSRGCATSSHTAPRWENMAVPDSPSAAMSSTAASPRKVPVPRGHQTGP
ncbi:hypothetical protein [Streptomyces sp. NBC_01306]|uniref:hypothetical protein n=1 Tax=Streptomyces sp. NBC_01306 TaxID=2903819 RepID=UPI0022581ADE|nr:hypothetical protein [Streptomyces sp. NBC_01306]MCX4729319.1 hypothetical protein [Streptomyces sp. NBC_01306]